MQADVLADSYSSMAFFDSDLSNKCKLLKRAVDILEDLLGRLHPELHLSFCIHVWYELGTLYFAMIGHQMKLMSDSNDSNSNQNSKIIDLCKKCLCNYQRGQSRRKIFFV